MSPARHRQKVLVFEDREDDFILVQGALRTAGYHVTRAASPEDFREHQPYDQFVLILMDLYLGKVQKVGIQLTREVHDVNPHVPVVVVSSKEPGRHEVAEAFRAGAFDYVDKYELLRDVTAALSRVHALAEDREELRMEAQLPLPVAFLYRDLLRSHSSYRRRLERMIELFEVTLKVMTYSLLAVHRTTAQVVLRKELRTALTQPSLGHLMSALTQLPETDGFLHRLWVVAQRRDFRDLGASFIQLRNDYVGHGAPQREPVYAKLVSRHQPRVDELLQMVSCLLEWQLVVPLHSDLLEDGIAYELRVFRGSNPEPTVDQRVARLTLKPIRHVHLVDSNFVESVDLFPWCQYLACEQCLNEKLFLYRMCRHGELWLVDHVYGHMQQTTSGWPELQTMLGVVSQAAS